MTSIFYNRHYPTIESACERWGLVYDTNAEFELIFEDNVLTLIKRDEPKLKGISVDFVSGAVAHRRKFGGGRGQSIAKAVGLKQGVSPTVVDGTAGLGRDAFVLASLGCKVLMVERHPIVAALLEDGLRRAYEDAEIGDWMRERMSLFHGSSIDSLADAAAASNIAVDVVYLDPMYPHREKSALVKKEMRVFQSLVGADLDADGLLAPAMALATKRVVVKRPDYADDLDGVKPSMVIATKKNRFDVYVKAAMTA
ncbi:class I SAM-dependent methyltransferase [Shewanella fidelis]|uniref:Ribosomal RNA small subunit methyltransferase J n=1 Tax=Shewanella fidelis TaxID=173509 RepID=A0AAW8NS73_9GAMM|nr:class I SAM-dependent methyltransferase [Shewanella fidelis]MDR8525655.1 class I SAM-dependent methyltransferase [Shewanella fidelis]MDW4812835.1 class I SAM-dependent methyltransferase [Shewanella fidelis]MDW4816583.1 class I SAM-dependent methyltransferase [Shewanella fidelis]MDW4820253.1 class I SAM-dependent methyltransferase [Shewanella fidelis]MDW4825300.1 class I SAM-dependent methyltransferase [Shewanella fidelis]